MSRNINVASVKFHLGLECGLLSQQCVAQDCWLDALVMVLVKPWLLLHEAGDARELARSMDHGQIRVPSC